MAGGRACRVGRFARTRPGEDRRHRDGPLFGAATGVTGRAGPLGTPRSVCPSRGAAPAGLLAFSHSGANGVGAFNGLTGGELSESERLNEPTEPIELTVSERLNEPTEPIELTVSERLNEPTEPIELTVSERLNGPTEPTELTVSERLNGPTEPTELTVSERLNEPTEPIELTVSERLNEPIELTVSERLNGFVGGVGVMS